MANIGRHWYYRPGVSAAEKLSVRALRPLQAASSSTEAFVRAQADPSSLSEAAAAVAPSLMTPTGCHTLWLPWPTIPASVDQFLGSNFALCSSLFSLLMMGFSALVTNKSRNYWGYTMPCFFIFSCMAALRLTWEGGIGRGRWPPLHEACMFQRCISILAGKMAGSGSPDVLINWPFIVALMTYFGRSVFNQTQSTAIFLKGNNVITCNFVV